MSSCVYVLKLEDDCYYVGRTSDLLHRFLMHKNATGAVWTKTHKVVSIVELQEDAPFKELTTTLEYMNRYGIEKVRGGPWCTLNIVPTEVRTIEQLIESESFARSESNVKPDQLEPVSKRSKVEVPEEATIKEEPEDLSRQGMYWNNDEIDVLIFELQCNTHLKDIARKHQRTEAAIRARIGHIIRGYQAKGLPDTQIAERLHISDVNNYK